MFLPPQLEFANTPYIWDPELTSQLYWFHVHTDSVVETNFEIKIETNTLILNYHIEHLAQELYRATGMKRRGKKRQGDNNNNNNDNTGELN